MHISGLFCNRKDVRNRRLTKRNDGLVALLRHFRHTGDRKERQVAEMTTGEKIAVLRKEQGMSQEALGEKLGLSRQAVSKWEADQAVPTMDNLMELSKLFGVPVDTLLRPDAELMPKAEDSDESWPGAENQPVRNGNRKWKIAAIAAAGLLCVSVVCSAVSLWRVLAMQQQIDTLRMQSGPSTIYYPDNTSAENSDLADWSENVTVDRQNSENLLVTVSAVPRSMMDGETAKFVVRSGDQSWECDAEDNNGYSGKLSVPFVDTFSVYLTLTGMSGETRNILVTSEYDLEQRLRLSVTAHWNNGGISSTGGKNPTTTVSGGVEVRVYCSSEDVKPASSNIVLYRNGKVQDMQPIDIKDFTGDSTFYTDVNWRNLEGELGEYRVKVVMLDNFDKLYTADVD
jgi:transcriptional regulator with XRE-family HTH domain